jgi:hypothetical protein
LLSCRANLQLQVYILYAQGCPHRLDYCEFPAKYLDQVRDTRRPTEGPQLQRSRAYDILEQEDCGEFWDLSVALPSNIEHGVVRTGYA